MVIDAKLLEKSEAGDQKRRGFAAGFAVACVELATTHMQEDLAAMLLRDAGLSLETFRAAGVDEDDVATIERVLRDNKAKPFEPLIYPQDAPSGLTEEDLETILIIARNHQSGRITHLEIKTLVAAYRAKTKE